MSSKTTTKQRMIEAALDLFHSYGVNGTSVDQILAKSGTGKSQFTYYFKNKNGLIHAVIQFLHEVVKSGKVASSYDINTWDDFEAWFQRYIDFQVSVDFERSCPLGTIGADLSRDQELLRQDIRLFLEWSRSRIARFFAERKAGGELVSTADPDALADLCISVMQGGMLLTKVKRSPDMFENAAAQTIQYVRSLRVHRDDS